MRVSWNWLQDFVDLRGLDPHDVAETLTLAGLEVEGVEFRGQNLQGVVVARVEDVQPHPDADRLRVCRVSDGAQELQIVCGASNVVAGALVPLATIGTMMPSGLKIKKSKLRGELSEGMLCSASELGLEDEVDGLLILAPELPIGQDIADALQLKDIVLDISLTPDRGDCLSVRGVAREIAVLLGRPLRETPLIPVDFAVGLSGTKAKDSIRVEVQAPERCLSYSAAVIRNVEVAPSPIWMQRRLEAVGQRPLNNIVDVTNYINLEFGQPVHAFDLEKLAGAALVIRQANAGESMQTLDEKSMNLIEDDLVIADVQQPAALAGVMGGLNSSVGDNTTTVVLEVAAFEAGGVRRTARRYHQHTESSHRFERGTDATAIPAVVERAIQLFAATQPEGVVSTRDEGVVSVIHGSWAPKRIPLSMRELKRIIGVEYRIEEVHTALQGLGFGVEGDDEMIVEVPPRRPDIERTIDLVEEVGRVIGYERLPNELPKGALGFIHQRRSDAPVEQSSQPIVSTDDIDALDALREAMFTMGLFEAVNWGIGDPAENELLVGKGAQERLKNPLSSSLAVMRTTLLAGLLRNLKWNIARRAERVGLFEVAHVFPHVGGDRPEGENIAGVLFGKRDQGWHAANESVDIWDVTALVTRAGRVLRRPVELATATDAPPWVHPQAGAEIRVSGQKIGHVGQIHPEIAAKLDIKATVFAFEADLDRWLSVQPTAITEVRVPRTLSAERDLAVTMDASVVFETVAKAIDTFKHPLVADVRLFDVYSGPNLAEGKRSLAFRASYRHATESLTDAQIDEAHQALTEHLGEFTGAERRG